MVVIVCTETGVTGLEVVKAATTVADRCRLAREATLLHRAAHPGVVEIDGEVPGELRLRYRGTPLAMLEPLPADQATAFVRVVAETLADLHQVGIAHGRIRADHVVIDEGNRARLCGFADAAEATDESRAADVADLGGLLEQLLERGADRPWSHLGGWRHGTHRRQALRRLHTATAAAQHPVSGRRPTARQFAAALHDALPRMNLPRRGEEGGWTDADLERLAEPVNHGVDAPQAAAEVVTVDIEPRSRRLDPRMLTVVAGLVLLGGVMVGSSIARTLRPFGSAPLDETTATTRAPVRIGSPRDAHLAACSVAAPAGPDVDGDGCGDPVALQDRIASIGQVRIELGRPGDLAVVADSDCDGVATPVLLRPSTGEIFVFDEWTIDEAVEVSARAVVPGAGTISTGDGRCPPVVVTGEGAVHHVVAGGGG